ncbi:hypothetical protein AB204_02300 [Xenorhabdus khoisanae]|uniref:Uncharacterized protein n=1 Tax=Xenorhabdus khoisanae TaxID=880157 RepID=A0A0J5FWV0_9GAMM|nr:hypothetical protein [Xenorhabdus khoisanae]KMJ46673.1 hypothetical protein AB204_02300 [Xenorhabdus khoisanae]
MTSHINKKINAGLAIRERLEELDWEFDNIWNIADQICDIISSSQNETGVGMECIFILLTGLGENNVSEDIKSKQQTIASLVLSQFSSNNYKH